jgi:hypothetical protein
MSIRTANRKILREVRFFEALIIVLRMFNDVGKGRVPHVLMCIVSTVDSP